MQTVSRVNQNISPVMDEIDHIYAYLSEKPTSSLFPMVYDSSFEGLINTFNEYTGNTWRVKYTDREYKPIKPIENNNLILAFSGGKDSIASALKFKRKGYNIHLYHLKHINPSFSDEWKCAERIANILEMPIYFDDISLKGHHMYMEHPMKNMLIANGALSYGVREGITTNIAFGNYTNSFLSDNPFDRCAGDCINMWYLYEDIIDKIIPDFSIYLNLQSMGETLNLLLDRKDLLNESLSCLCRHSLRDYRRQWVKDKFGIDLFNNRCGSCYKCCVEYIHMADHDRLSFSEEYYKYCLGQLYKVGVAEGEQFKTLKDLWAHFFIYPYTESKIAEQMDSAVLLAQKIKWKN